MTLRDVGGWCAALVLAAANVAAGEGLVPLSEAVRKQDAAGIRALLQRGVDVNLAEADGTTALHWAAHLSDVETVTLLVQAGANVNAANRLGVRPLSLACEGGSA